MNIHDSISSLAAHVTEQKDSLNDADKCKVTSDSSEENALQVEEYQKDI